MVNLPDWIFLGLAVRIKSDGVVFPEIRSPYPAVVRTDVDEVADLIVIIVIKASVADSITCICNSNINRYVKQQTP